MGEVAERTSSGAGDEQVEAVAEVLAAHRLTTSISRRSRAGLIERDRVCTCGALMPWNIGAAEPAHRAHVAAALAPLLAARPDDGAGERLAAVEALADEWERDGFDMEADQIRDALGQGGGGKGAQEGQGGDLRASGVEVVRGCGQDDGSGREADSQ